MWRIFISISNEWNINAMISNGICTLFVNHAHRNQECQNLYFQDNGTFI